MIFNVQVALKLGVKLGGPRVACYLNFPPFSTMFGRFFLIKKGGGGWGWVGGFLAPTINQNNITKLLARAALFFRKKKPA